MTNPKVFFDIAIGGKKAGRMVFKLFKDIVPKTSENFRALYFTTGDGRGGESIYGSRFDDENFKLKHTKKGQLSMANAGPNTNGSQFFMTFIPCSWLDGKHVVFGEVVNGMNVLDKMQQNSSSSGQPQQEIKIVDCGELD
ncbi:peptidyl-prolyl cis-trans isomerase cyp63 [Anaeramoeba flamelloides]|uniref:peptidylprolyl isomerase n=1 Tax=Anaeramoeba flamelloides TaxID=1746091 RepID=A0AAV7Z181_9EUKA|nr:peptidyl-prolyl cis-trans isomerase cyp63 [Anaeramoeba flamelloides]